MSSILNIEKAFEDSKGFVLNPGKGYYLLSKSKQEQLKMVFPRSKDITETCEVKEEQKHLYILDLMGTLFEASLVIDKDSKEHGEKMKTYYHGTEAYQTRLESVAQNINTLLSNGNEVAIVTSHDHTDPHWMNEILHDIENSLSQDNHGKVHYYICGSNCHGKTVKDKTGLIKQAKEKIEAYDALIKNFPNCFITLVDDSPADDALKLLDNQAVNNRLDMVLINDILHSHVMATVEGRKMWARKGNYEPDSDEILKEEEKRDLDSLLWLNAEGMRKHFQKFFNHLGEDKKNYLHMYVEKSLPFCQTLANSMYLLNILIHLNAVDGNVNFKTAYDTFENYDTCCYHKLLASGRLQITTFDEWWNIILKEKQNTPAKKIYTWKYNPYKQKDDNE